MDNSIFSSVLTSFLLHLTLLFLSRTLPPCFSYATYVNSYAFILGGMWEKRIVGERKTKQTGRDEVCGLRGRWGSTYEDPYSYPVHEFRVHEFQETTTLLM